MNLHKSIKTTLAALIIFALCPTSTHTGALTKTVKFVGNGAALAGCIKLATEIYANKAKPVSGVVTHSLFKTCTALAVAKGAISSLNGMYNAALGDSESDNEYERYHNADEYDCEDEQ